MFVLDTARRATIAEHALKSGHYREITLACDPGAGIIRLIADLHALAEVEGVDITSLIDQGRVMHSQQTQAQAELVEALKETEDTDGS